MPCKSLHVKLLKKCEQAVVKAVGIEKDNRLIVKAKLAQGDGFKHFVQCAEPARERDEGVGFFVHYCFALPPGFGDDEFITASINIFALDKSLWNHSDNFCAVCLCRARKGAHQADVSAAINERRALLSKGFAKSHGLLNILFCKRSCYVLVFVMVNDATLRPHPVPTKSGQGEVCTARNEKHTLIALPCKRIAGTAINTNGTVSFHFLWVRFLNQQADWVAAACSRFGDILLGRARFEARCDASCRFGQHRQI